jgi:hypothetical protein
MTQIQPNWVGYSINCWRADSINSLTKIRDKNPAVAFHWLALQLALGNIPSEEGDRWILKGGCC